MEIFIYGDTETDYLKKRDKVLGAAIDKIGPIRREVMPDFFQALVKGIVGQQISAKAQATIWSRMNSRFANITPQEIIACPENELQSFGITFKKAAYIHNAARMIADGTLDIDALRSKTDAEISAILTQIPGIGVWTAEMLMLFSMQRPDILSFGDLAILRGMRILYHHREIPRQLFEKYRRRYSPYGSTASLYLWAIGGQAAGGQANDDPVGG